MSDEKIPFPGKMKIFGGKSNPKLAGKIADYLGEKLGKVKMERFSDGELYVEYEESIRGTDVFIIQSTNQPDGNLFELLAMIYAAVGASAGRVTAVIPYFGYARQDRKPAPRTAITAKLAAILITAAGADRVLTMDLHAGQITGFFDQKKTKVDHLYAKPVFTDFLSYLYDEDIKAGILTINAPDTGAANTARAYAKKVGNVPIAIIDKRRPKPNEAEIITIIGDVKDRNILMIDDIVDTAGTITKGAEALIKSGAKKVDALCTHAVLSGSAIGKLQKSPISNFFVTDTIPIANNQLLYLIHKIKIISVARLFAEAIKEIHDNGSVSRLFD